MLAAKGLFKLWLLANGTLEYSAMTRMSTKRSMESRGAVGAHGSDSRQGKHNGSVPDTPRLLFLRPQSMKERTDNSRDRANYQAYCSASEWATRWRSNCLAPQGWQRARRIRCQSWIVLARGSAKRTIIRSPRDDGMESCRETVASRERPTNQPRSVSQVVRRSRCRSPRGTGQRLSVGR